MKVVTLTFASWNQIAGWLKRLYALKVAAHVADAPLGAVALMNNFDFSCGDSLTRDEGWTELEH